MRYFDDMLDFRGFKNGETLPGEAKTLRPLYIDLVNARAAVLGSEYRVVACNSSTGHNPCRIKFVFAEAFAAYTRGNNDAVQLMENIVEPAITDAIEWARNQGVDRAVTVAISVNNELYCKLLAEAKELVPANA